MRELPAPVLHPVDLGDSLPSRPAVFGWNRVAPLVAALVALIAWVPAAHAQTVDYFTKSTGFYTSANWSTTARPAYGQEAVLDSHYTGTSTGFTVAGSITTSDFVFDYASATGCTLKSSAASTTYALHIDGAPTDTTQAALVADGGSVGDLLLVGDQNGTASTLTIGGNTNVGGTGDVVVVPHKSGNFDVLAGSSLTLASNLSGLYLSVAYTATITKTGAGTLTLSGNNTFTGGLILSAGTVYANSMTKSLGTGNSTVNGGVLAGSGLTGAGSVTIASGGTIRGGLGTAAAGAPTTLTTSALTWQTGGTFVDNIATDGSSADKLTMSSLTPSASAGGFTVNVTSSGPLAVPGGQSVVLANDTDVTQTNGVPNNAFAPANSSATLAELTLQINGVAYTGSTYSLSTQLDADQTTYDLVLTAATPEPTSALLLGLAVAPFALRRRRR